MPSRVVGVVQALYRYPVKSMRGESLAETPVGWQGLPGDRRYAFVRPEDRSVFPYLTARQVPELLRYTPFLTDPANPEKSPVMVRTPEGEECAVGSEALRASIARRYARPFNLLRLGLTGTFDIAPLSLITTGTLTALGEALGMVLHPLRFRPTIFVATPEGESYPEEGWVGHVLIFGEDEVRVRVNQRDTRCKMITLDQDTAAAEPRVLEEVVRSRGERAGVYGVAEQLGTLRVGQSVRLVQDPRA